jgi:hypothetical protein
MQALVGRLDSRDARDVTAQLAAALGQARGNVIDVDRMKSLSAGLSVLAGRLDSRDAREVAAALTEALSETTDPTVSMSLSAGLSAVAGRLDPRDVRDVAAALTHALSTRNLGPFQRLMEGGLSDLLSGEPADTSRDRALALGSTLASASDPSRSLAALALLAPAVAPLPPRLPPQDLVDLLKHPLCVGEARRVVLGQLSRHYQRPFADQWEFVRFATEQRRDLDLTSPPQRYRPGSAASAEKQPRPIHRTTGSSLPRDSSDPGQPARNPVGAVITLK